MTGAAATGALVEAVAAGAAQPDPGCGSGFADLHAVAEQIPGIGHRPRRGGGQCAPDRSGGC